MSKGKSPSVFERCRNKAIAEYRPFTKTDFRKVMSRFRPQEVPADPDEPNGVAKTINSSQRTAAIRGKLL